MLFLNILTTSSIRLNKTNIPPTIKKFTVKINTPRLLLELFLEKIKMLFIISSVFIIPSFNIIKFKPVAGAVR